MNSDFPWNKIGKYLSGECSAEVERKIEAWIESEKKAA